MKCTVCGGTGIRLDGSPCTCVANNDNMFANVTCLEIPEQYQQIIFNQHQLPNDIIPAYGKYLTELADNLMTGRTRNCNILIGSPVCHGKTIFAYSCIARLNAMGLEVFPLYDVLELNKMMNDMDGYRKATYAVDAPERILTCPVLFTCIPNRISIDVYDAITLLISRRVRRGNTTIFLYNGTWEQLVKFDYNGILKDYLGDGSGYTILNKSWYRSTKG